MNSQKGDGYPGVKYSYEKGQGRARRSLELHPDHNGHGRHLQLNKWDGRVPGILRSALRRWRLW